MQILVDYCVLMSLFIGVSARIVLFGYLPMDGFNTGIYKFSPLSIALLLFLLFRKKKMEISPFIKVLFAIVAFIYLYGIIFLKYPIVGSSFYVVNAYLTPLLVLLWAKNVQGCSYFNNIKRMFFCLVLLEIGLSVCEKVVGFLAFPYSLYNPLDLNGTMDGVYFRANSLLGHPLTNAFVVAVLTMFYYKFSDGRAEKYIVFLGGIVSLLCFNARGALLLLTIFLIIDWILNSSFSFLTIVKSTLISVIAIYSIYYLANRYGFGDRIFQMEIGEDDSSTMVRIEALDFLLNSSQLNWFTGVGAETSDMAHIENWLLDLIFRYGIFLALVIAFYIIIICLYSVRTYGWKNIYLLFGLFISVASTNNSLSNNSPALPIFLVCAVFFCDKFTMSNQIQPKF